MSCRTQAEAHEFYQLLDKDGITDDIQPFNEKLRKRQSWCRRRRSVDGPHL